MWVWTSANINDHSVAEDLGTRMVYVGGGCGVG